MIVMHGVVLRPSQLCAQDKQQSKNSHRNDMAWARKEFWDNHNLLLSGFLSHAFDNFATNLGTIFRGIKRCAKTLNLLRAPGTVKPPPSARTRRASCTTSSGV